MSRIDIENAKTLRQSMKVICGLDVPEGEISSVSATNTYDGVVGDVSTLVVSGAFMDLSGNGFLNDGNAIPLPATHDGFLTTIGSQSVITITMSSAVEADIPIIVYGYEGEELKKWTGSTVAGTTQTVTIESSNKRRYIAKVNVGNSWWFDNDTLISCDVQLRAVEVKVDNPSLQMSEIEIKGYEPNNILDKIAYINENNPIYYSAGYIGDMSPMRKFYLDGLIEWEDKVITIKGTDATRFLDVEYAGKYLGNANGTYSSGFNGIVNNYHDMLNNCGVSHTFINEIADAEWAQSSMSFLLPKKTVRQLIAQASNMFKFYATTDGARMYLDYIDAGIPTLKVKNDRDYYSVVVIENYANFKATSEQAISTIKMQDLELNADDSATISTQKFKGEKIFDFSEPYYSFSANAGTVTKLSPYAVKVKTTSKVSVTLSGRKLIGVDDYDGAFSPLTVTNGGNGRTIELEELCGLQGTSGTFRNMSEVLTRMLNEETIMYEFDFRGDPRIQPRTMILVDTGEMLDDMPIMTIMTIESISLNHENGGLTSHVVARRGVI